MGFLDFVWARISEGPSVIIYDGVCWFFVIYRLYPFIRNFKDDLVRNVYLAVFFSVIYSSSVGILIDYFDGEQDSEFRVVFGVIGAYFILQVVFSLWKRFGDNSLVLTGLISRKLQIINIAWLLLSLSSFVILEFLLGGPTIYKLHNEYFTIEQNIYLGWGRIITRSYIIFTTTLCCIIIIRLIRGSFADDPRLRFRYWAGLGVVLVGGLHYAIISIGTLIVIVNYNLESQVRDTYEIIATVLILFAAIVVFLLACPANLLDLILRLRNHLRSYFIFHNVDGLRQELVRALEQREDINIPGHPFQRNYTGSREDRLTNEVIDIADMRRLVLSFLSEMEVDDLIDKLPDYRQRYKRVREEVLTEALFIDLALEKMQSKEALSDGQLSTRIPEATISSFEDLSDFYSDVVRAMRRIRRSPIKNQSALQIAE